MSLTAKHIIFIGQIPGVHFRLTVFDIASRYQLTGFVHGLPDSNVEMVTQGALDDIDNCIQNIKETFAGYIRETKTADITFDPQYKDFKIIF